MTTLGDFVLTIIACIAAACFIAVLFNIFMDMLVEALLRAERKKQEEERKKRENVRYNRVSGGQTGDRKQ